MRSVSAELATALTTPERVLTPRIHCDWDGDGYNGNGTVDDVARSPSTLQIDQVLTSSVPSAAQPIAGAAVGQLTADIEQGHLFGSAALPVVRGITSSTAATGTGTISVTRGPVSPGDTVFVWIANGGEQFYIYTNGMNVTWNQLMTGGDFNSTATHVITGRLMCRRIGITQADVDAEPSTYTFNVVSNPAWVAHCVVVASGLTPGIHAFTRRSGDPIPRRNDTYGSLAGRPITTTLDNCLILGFFAGYAAPGGGVSWTPDSPAVELVDLCSASGRDNIATCITQVANAPAGLYTLSATISATTEPGVVATVALAPAINGDETQNAAWVYSELNTRSTLAGKTRLARPMTAQLDVATTVGVQSVPLFTGQSLGVDVSSRARKATFTALDNRELMRGDPSQLAKLANAVIAENPAIASGETLPTYPGLEATWLVSYLFSYCRVGFIGSLLSRGAWTGDGFFASPTVRTSTILHVPCHGSLEAFIGSTLYAYQQSSTATQTRPAFARGPWVASTAPAPVGGKIDAKWFCDSGFFCAVWTPNFTGQAGTKGRIECYLRQSISGSGTATLGCSGRFDVTQFCFLDLSTAGVLQLRLSMPGGITRTVAGPTLPNDQAWHAVGVHWDSVTGSATFRIDSTDTVVGFAAFTNATITDNGAWGFATLTDGIALAEFQVNGGYPLTSTILQTNFIRVTDPWAWQNFTPTAFIDKSDNVMDSTLAIDTGVDCYALLSELADAEFAAVYFDADGHPHYRTRYSDNTTAGQTVVRTLTTLNALKDVDYQSGLDQLANSIAMSFSPITVRDSVQVWQPSSPLRIPANAGAYPINVTIPGIRNPLVSDTYVVGNANTKPDGSGIVVGGVSITAQAVGTNATIFLGNVNAFDVWMVDVSGNPTISWNSSIVEGGTAVLGTTVTDVDSIRAHGTQGITNGVADSKWRQRQDVGDGLSRVLLADLAAPLPVLTNIKIVGDPRLEIGDLVRFVDRDGLGFDGSYRLVGISPSYSIDEGFTQTLVARRTGCGVAVWDTNYWDDCSVWGA